MIRQGLNHIDNDQQEICNYQYDHQLHHAHKGLKIDHQLDMHTCP